MLSTAGVPSRHDPSGLDRSNGKRPDGVTMVPWSSGKPLVWDSTCPDTLAPSRVCVAVRSPGSVAKAAEVKSVLSISLSIAHILLLLWQYKHWVLLLLCKAMYSRS